MWEGPATWAEHLRPIPPRFIGSAARIQLSTERSVFVILENVAPSVSLNSCSDLAKANEHNDYYMDEMGLISSYTGYYNSHVVTVSRNRKQVVIRHTNIPLQSRYRQRSRGRDVRKEHDYTESDSISGLWNQSLTLYLCATVVGE